MITNNSSDIQLFSLIKNLSDAIQHKDYLGTLLGYSVVSGLIGHQTLIGTAQNYKKKLRKTTSGETIKQLKFEEVKSVYTDLQSAIKIIEKEGINAAVSDLSSKVDGRINELIENNISLNNYQSVLLKNIVVSIGKEKNLGDNLRKKGLILVDIVMQKKNYNRPIDYLNEDYRSISQAFVNKTMYQYL